MSIWKRLLSRIGLRTYKRSRTRYNIGLRTMVSEAAKRESRPESEFIHELLVAGLQTYYSRKKVVPKWESLSPREKHVATYIAKGMTNEQIANLFSVSPETIKTHVANIIRKFEVKDKSEVRQMLGVMKRNHWI